MRILIVDDSSMMRMAIKRVVLLANVQPQDVFEAGNGAEALSLLESREIDLLLTDINMPVMTGIELLKKLAVGTRWSRLVRVVISTDGSASRRDEVAGLDVRCYLEKPFSPEVMRDVLAEASRLAGV